MNSWKINYKSIILLVSDYMNPVDKVLLIVDGESGAGQDISETFSKNGARIVLIYTDKEKAVKLKEKIEKMEGIINIFSRDEKNLYDKVKQIAGRVDIIINNIYFENINKGNEDFMNVLQSLDYYINFIKNARNFGATLIINAVYNKDDSFEYSMVKSVFDTFTLKYKTDARIFTVSSSNIDPEYIEKLPDKISEKKLQSSDITNAIIFSTIEDGINRKILDL
ncbi:hypothetical protein SE19_02140 [Acidiplasma aeolicum]|uniref:Short-chain dehydrogenase n=2 Tax=Ferroplasmaceae TaxID=90142 RepID=A0A0P9DBL9_9ARCH|nr:hypothetical protein SE19_02140 [Acidiplasma aeolicum]